MSDELERRVTDAPDFQDQVAESVAQNTDLDKKVAEILHERHKWRWRVLWIWMLAFTIVALSLYVSNRHRINDVQSSRVEACSLVASTIHDVFAPFAPPPEVRTQQDINQIELFNKTLKQKKQKCINNVEAANP